MKELLFQKIRYASTIKLTYVGLPEWILKVLISYNQLIEKMKIDIA